VSMFRTLTPRSVIAAAWGRRGIRAAERAVLIVIQIAPAAPAAPVSADLPTLKAAPYASILPDRSEFSLDGSVLINSLANRRLHC